MNMRGGVYYDVITGDPNETDKPTYFIEGKFYSFNPETIECAGDKERVVSIASFQPMNISMFTWKMVLMLKYIQRTIYNLIIFKDYLRDAIFSPS